MEIKLQIIPFTGLGRGGKMEGVKTIKKQEWNVHFRWCNG